MAQTGYSKVQIYSSSTATHTPSASNLTNDTNGSELAINITDGKLFYKDNSGTVQVLATKGAGTIGGSNTQVQYNSSGTFAGSANLTFDGTTLTSLGFSGPLNGTVGATTANTGAFTTLSASSTVSGTGFSTYLASPPAIGGTAPSTGKFTTLTSTLNVINGATSGAITLAVPAVSGSNTATFPAATGTVMVSGNMPAFSAYPSATQSSISNGTWTKVTLDLKDFDTNSNFASSRFTPTVAGYYQINGSVYSNATTINPSDVRSAIYKNGSLFKGVRQAGGTGSPMISCVVFLNGSTDYVELYGFLDNATGGQFLATYTNMSGSLMRAS